MRWQAACCAAEWLNVQDMVSLCRGTLPFKTHGSQLIEGMHMLSSR